MKEGPQDGRSCGIFPDAGHRVPLGMEDPDHPNISATLWCTVADHDARRYYFESTVSPAVFWVDLDKVNLEPGADVMKLETLGPRTLAGEVSSD